MYTQLYNQSWNILCKGPGNSSTRPITTVFRWQFELNVSKCKSLLISNCRKPAVLHYHLNNSPLETVDNYKYLGVKITSKLSWNDHTADVSLKASRILNVLRRSMHGCSQQAEARAYVSLVRPHLETCAPVWSPHGKVAKVQRRATRWICGARWDRDLYQWTKHHEDCRSMLRGLLTIQQRH